MVTGMSVAHYRYGTAEIAAGMFNDFKWMTIRGLKEVSFGYLYGCHSLTAPLGMIGPLWLLSPKPKSSRHRPVGILRINKG